MLTAVPDDLTMTQNAEFEVAGYYVVLLPSGMSFIVYRELTVDPSS